MSDEMLVRLGENNGVIQINFGSFFLSGAYRNEWARRRREMNQHLRSQGMKEGEETARELMQRYRSANPIQYADITDVVAHVDHVVQLIGAEHVGLGSDFDGVGDSLPVGLKDVSDYPNLIHEFLKRGYSEDDIEKICSGNVLRVWSEVERIAQELQTD